MFKKINKGYNSVFQAGKLSIGVVVPIEQYTQSPIPTMYHHLERVKLVEKLGFKSIWLRDVPLNVPTFGDAGQTFDPFTYLGYLAGQTSTIGLGIASIALPLHHPIHIAKSAATINLLSDGRLILGIASGDRREEYPAMNIDYENRGKAFCDAFDYIRAAHKSFPTLENNHFGQLNGKVDILPKSPSEIPMLVTGFSRQTLEWNAENSNGWIYYPRNLYQQNTTIQQWQNLLQQKSDFDKPFMQPLYIDLQNDDDYTPKPIHLGFKIGANHLVNYFKDLQTIGVNHVAINLRFNTNTTEQTLEQLAEKVLPYFH